MAKSRAESWAIHLGRISDRSSYFESDVRKEYLVVNTITKKVFMRFSRSEYANAYGDSESGIDNLEFSDDEKTLIATYVDGTVEQHLLPE